MRLLFLLFFSSFARFVYAQQFEIPAEGYPFSQIVEWKGIGAILLNRDPNYNLRQMHLTLVANSTKSVWNESFNTIVPDLWFVSEDGGKYAYFFENFNVKDGKVSFHQLSIAGNLKFPSVAIAPALKRIGNFKPEDLVLNDVVTTERALVYLFSHTDNSAKKKTTIAISFTHHNQVPYAIIVAENVTSSSKVEDQVSWYLAGEKGESLIFAARVHAGGKAGWQIKQYSPKGELENEMTLSATGTNLAGHNRTGFGTRGSAVIDPPHVVENGTLVYHKDRFYLGGIEASATGAQVVSYYWEEKTWKRLNSTPVSKDVWNVKKTMDVGFFPLNEGIGWYVGLNGKGEGHFHSDNAGKAHVAGAVSQYFTDPSMLLTTGYNGKFVASLPDKLLLFDLKQLGKQGPVTFELTNK